jgi:hypothetical protein
MCGTHTELVPHSTRLCRPQATPPSWHTGVILQVPLVQLCTLHTVLDSVNNVGPTSGQVAAEQLGYTGCDTHNCEQQLSWHATAIQGGRKQATVIQATTTQCERASKQASLAASKQARVHCCVTLTPKALRQSRWLCGLTDTPTSCTHALQHERARALSVRQRRHCTLLPLHMNNPAVLQS